MQHFPPPHHHHVYQHYQVPTHHLPDSTQSTHAFHLRHQRPSSEVVSGRWGSSAATKIHNLKDADPGTIRASLCLSGASPITLRVSVPGPSPVTTGAARRRSVSVVSSSTEYVRCVNARGAQRLVRRPHQQGAVEVTPVRGVGAKIHHRFVFYLRNVR